MKPRQTPLLTRDEAMLYLHDELHVDTSTMRTHPIAFITLVTSALHRTVPFQSFSLLLLPRAFRRLPLHAQIKRDVLARVGGCCYVLNVWLRELLRVRSRWLLKMKGDGGVMKVC
jgi:hypothetical protein